MTGQNVLGALEAHVSDASARAIAVWSAHLAMMRMRIRRGDGVLFSHDSTEHRSGEQRLG